MTRRPALVAAAIAVGLIVSPLVAVAPASGETAPGPPTEVALVVAITVPASDSGLISADDLTTYTSPFGLLTRELDQVADRPVTLGIDPRIIASIRILGTTAPQSAVAWLERLDAATNETFALSWGDSDLTMGLEAGSPVVLAPESLDFAIDPALFSAAVEQPTSTPTPSPTPSADNTDDDTPPPLPTTESLLDWDYTLPSVGWPDADTVTAATFDTLAQSFDEVLLASSNLTGTIGAGSTAVVGEHPALVIDSPLSSLFSATVNALPGTDFDSALAAFGIAATTAATGTAESAIITLDRDVAVSDSNLGPTIDALAVNPAVQLVGLEAVADNPGTAASILDLPQDPAAVAVVADLLRLDALDAEFGQIIADPSLVSSERRLTLLSTLSNQWDADPVGWATATDQIRTSSVDFRASVKITKSSSITLLSDRGALPVTVSNDLDQPITVYITVRPLTPLLRVEDNLVELTVEPNSQRKAQIPVQSISNGVVELEISLHGAASQQIGYTTYVRTTVQAGWETPFTVVVAILVLLVFAGGIIRTVLRRRKLREEPEIGA